MKTFQKAYNPAVNAENLEDIVFEGRNQAYGAYSLRRNYNTRINLSTLTVLSIASMLALTAFIRTLHKPPVPTEPKKKITIIANPENDDDLKPQQLKVEVPREMTKVVVYGPPTRISDIEKPDPGLLEERPSPTAEPAPDPGDIELVPMPAGPDPTGIVETTKEPWEVTEPPVFDGDFREWLAKHIEYSSEAVANDIFGTVTLKFAIDEEGNVSDITILKGIHPLIDEAVIKALKQSPRWTPGKLNGIKVKVFYYLPVQFSIQGSI